MLIETCCSNQKNLLSNKYTQKVREGTNDVALEGAVVGLPVVAGFVVVAGLVGLST